MKNKQSVLVTTSNTTEFYTPEDIVACGRLALEGQIDLDPASSEVANRVVRAKRFFTVKDDALNREWRGHVWMNHPFGKRIKASSPDWFEMCDKRGMPYNSPYLPGNEDWVDKLIEEYKSGRVIIACCITYAATSERWFRPLADYLQCYLSPRTNYRDPAGHIIKGVQKGSVVTYLGPDKKLFRQAFSKKGFIK